MLNDSYKKGVIMKYKNTLQNFVYTNETRDWKGSNKNYFKYNRRI